MPSPLKEGENQLWCRYRTKTTLNLHSVLLALKGVISMPRKRNDACVNTCCLRFIFRLFHQKMESRDIWTSDLRPRLVFSGFPVYKGKFSIQTQPGAQPDLSVATKPGHVNCLSAPRGSVSSPHLSSPSYWFFSLLRQCLGISGGERNTMVCQAKKK